MKTKKLKTIIGKHEVAVVKELTERIKDMIYTDARSQVNEAIFNLRNKKMKGNHKIQFTWSLEIIANDIIQIVNREKRKKKNDS